LQGSQNHTSENPLRFKLLL